MLSRLVFATRQEARVRREALVEAAAAAEPGNHRGTTGNHGERRERREAGKTHDKWVIFP